MTKRVQHIIASYDIHDPKRLVRVAKIVKDFGHRVLKSVFECELTEDRFWIMKERVERVIDHMEDSVRYYVLCDACVKNAKVSGQGRPLKEDEPFIIA